MQNIEKTMGKCMLFLQRDKKMSMILLMGIYKRMK